MRVVIRTAALSAVMLACAIGGASAETPARDTETKAEAADAAPSTPSSLAPDMILVPTRDVRDAMLYLGGRASSDEMAAVVYRELGTAFMSAQQPGGSYRK